ncbi:hypothetical protein JKP88DRAFT_349794 [Tribonema minus]|uniref:Uncharacterized protein n=1 Tax=Tribonema minus TaxID=303371 RepID=A0A836CBZ3_9STRA|nr:hypothetical protein JKP88DRAFT_349794 [Tribonema minus]
MSYSWAQARLILSVLLLLGAHVWAFTPAALTPCQVARNPFSGIAPKRVYGPGSAVRRAAASYSSSPHVYYFNDSDDDDYDEFAGTYCGETYSGRDWMPPLACEDTRNADALTGLSIAVGLPLLVVTAPTFLNSAHLMANDAHRERMRRLKEQEQRPGFATLRVAFFHPEADAAEPSRDAASTPTTCVSDIPVRRRTSKLPGGTWCKTCSDAQYIDGQLRATCARKYGRESRISTVRALPEDEVVNEDGLLVNTTNYGGCTEGGELPGGTWCNSCIDATYVNGELSARCKGQYGRLWDNVRALPSDYVEYDGRRLINRTDYATDDLEVTASVGAAHAAPTVMAALSALAADPALPNNPRLLTRTCAELLRREARWVAVAGGIQQGSEEETDALLQRAVAQERTKWSAEVMTNIQGEEQRAPPPFPAAPVSTYAVVTLLLRWEHTPPGAHRFLQAPLWFGRSRVKDAAEARQLLLWLLSNAHELRLRDVEVLWSPAEAGDVMTEAEAYRKWPELRHG